MTSRMIGERTARNPVTASISTTVSTLTSGVMNWITACGSPPLNAPEILPS